MSAVAEELRGTDVHRGIDIFSRGSEEDGGRPWTLEDVRPPRALSAISSDRVRALGPRAGRPSEPPDAGDSAVGSVQPELLAPAGIACTAHPLPSGSLKKTNDPSPSVGRPNSRISPLGQSR